jgi:SAM-dependent methyltransferase
VSRPATGRAPPVASDRMDWTQWHDRYDTSPALLARLRIVRAHIIRGLEACPPGTVRILSICAGDGRDLIEALSDHPRSEDVHARLVELDPRLVEQGRATAAAAGLTKGVEFVSGDATVAAHYRDFAPADLVLACGVFGNVRRADASALVETLACLCRAGGSLVWTRGVPGRLRGAYARAAAAGHAADPAMIRELLARWDFEDVQIEETADGRFVVGTSRHRGAAPPLPAADRPLFAFTGPPG